MTNSSSISLSVHVGANRMNSSSSSRSNDSFASFSGVLMVVFFQMLAVRNG